MKSRLPNSKQQLLVSLIFGLILALIISSNLLSACNNQRVPLTLRFVAPINEADAWKPLIAQFNENNKNIKIVVTPSNTNITDNLEKQNRTRLAKQDLPEQNLPELDKGFPQFDLIYMDSVWLQDFADKKWLLKLNDYFKDDELKNFIQFDNKNEMYQGQDLYRIPFRTDVGVLFYRKDWLEKIKEPPPETFDDLGRISKEVKEQEVIGYGNLSLDEHQINVDTSIEYSYLSPISDNPYEGNVVTFLEVLWNFGGTWISDDIVTLLNNRNALENALKFLREIKRQNKNLEDLSTSENFNSSSFQNDKNEEVISSLFKKDKAVFMRNWPRFWNIINDGKPFSDKFGIGHVVKEETKEGDSKACRGGWGFGIASKTKFPNEALIAIKFLTSAATQQKFTLSYGSLPSRRSLFFDPKIVASNSYYPMFLDILENHSFSRPLIPKYRTASCILQHSLQEALDLDKDENAYIPVMEEAANDTQNLLKNTGKYTGKYNNCRE